MTGIKGEIDVDKAWNKLHGRLEENSLPGTTIRLAEKNRMSLMLRIAASVLIIAALGITALLLNRNGVPKEKSFIAGNDQRNLEFLLPDGSKVWLNRNSRITFNPGNFSSERIVRLTGEAFFDINHDPSRPFVIDAGKARIADIGTTFNVITSNGNGDVEVFVSTGKVLLSDISESNKMVIDPGYIGTLTKTGVGKSINRNQNYLSWKTDLLTYNGEQLSTVFNDLKRVYNINIIADDQDILVKQISTTFDKSPQDAIIEAICLSFNLNYHKEGNNYHLSKK